MTITWTNTTVRGLAAVLVMFLLSPTAGAATLNPTLLNAASNTGGDDPAGVSTGFAATSSLAGDTIEDAFGNNDGGVEPASFIFADGRTADNGNFTMGDAGESVDNITWSTNTLVVLDGYRLAASQDGVNPNRGTQLVRFSVEGEEDDFFDKNGGGGFVDRTFAIPQAGNDLQIEITHSTAAGARINEIDALTTDTSSAVVDTTIFNATTNTGGDDPAGLSTGFSNSPLVNGLETIEDAFGNTNGGVEATSVIFSDSGTVDNGNNTYGDGGETTDFIAWNTTFPIQLGGYQVRLEGDGGVEDGPRSTELVQFFVNGSLVDMFDGNGHTGTFQRLFSGGTITGDDFRIRLTRANGGPRIIEIDALNALVVPEPGALALAALGALGLFAAPRRRRTR